ncbi:hypothetical protein R3P38DRAFT_2799400 [Favolaschia claudopus]|uniref:Uncharacterized protein n=1 Tax=Favolaschia claudopus TaxID=2862362 RepID=A0AAV9ZZV2_9AGAR
MWGNVLVSANSVCRADERCLHSMIQGGMLLDASRLQNFAAVKNEGEYANCRGPHNVVSLPVTAQLSTIAIEVPARIISWTSINLKLLDVRTKADDTMCAISLTVAPVWKSWCGKETAPFGRQGRCQSPRYASFGRKAWNFPPPILALHLITLNVTDEENPFTAYQFKYEIFRTLRKLGNPDRLYDRTRTTLYGAIATRAQNQYLKYDRRKFESVQFAHGPPLNSWAVTARKRYEALCRVAFKVELNTVKFEPRAERLRVRKFPGGRQVWEDAQAELILANGMDPQMTRLYNQDFDPFHPDAKPSAITLVILTLDADGARSMFSPRMVL